MRDFKILKSLGNNIQSFIFLPIFTILLLDFLILPTTKRERFSVPTEIERYTFIYFSDIENVYVMKLYYG